MDTSNKDAEQIYTCGNYQTLIPSLITNMNPNPWSSIVGFSGKSSATNGAITEMTVSSFFDEVYGYIAEASSAPDAPDRLSLLKIAKNTIAVMEEYDAKVEKIKEANKAALLKDPRFREYGWILSDWCPDGFDAKQMTITTYI